MPTLYLIPVPIAPGALHTIPDYVRETVRALDFFVAERAKSARQFLKAAGTGKPLQEINVVEIDERDPGFAKQALLEAFRTGKDAGLLSEAGCPGVADPGAEFVALAHRENVTVRPLVGPSSLLLALMASGMNGQSFAFHGYLPPKRPELAQALRRLEQLSEKNGQTQIFIETPYRGHMVVEVALEALQPDTNFAVAQDLTGAQENVRSLPVRDWKKKSGAPELSKAPAVFLLYRNRK